MRQSCSSILALACVLLVFGCGHDPGGQHEQLAEAIHGTHEGPAPELTAAVENPARPEDDRARDADRKPAEVLDFFGIRPGMRVADLMCGTGYYTEILAGAVGPEGTVFAHNTPFVLERWYEAPLAERLAKPGLEHVERINSDFADPGLPADLDAALLIRFYHDFYWMGGDREAFNRAVFTALKPGGVFGVVDHHAEPGSGDRDTQTLHRVDAEMVKQEILAAGFELAAESGLLGDPDDTLDWMIYVDDGARRDKTSRFVYLFRKPAS